MDKPVLSGKDNELLSKEDQKVVDKLCSEFRNNLIRRFQDQDKVHQQLTKNPKVLGANALIAEHLHNHGYFISQSVFSSEIELPSANKLSSLQQHQPAYRLKESDIEEVLGALDLSLDKQEMATLIERYNKNFDASLLSTLLMWKKIPPQSKETTKKDLIAFNKYLKILVSRIAKVSLILTELKRKRQELNTHKKHKRSPTKSRSRSQQDSHIQDLARKIERLTSRLAAMQSGNEALFTGGRVSAKSYSDWVRELKNSRHGQRMIRKIEKIIVNSLNKEQVAMQKNYDEKLDTQKMILKLHYKQKFLEHFQALNLSNEPLMRKPLQPKNENGGGRGCSSTSTPPSASKKVKKRNYKQSSKKCSMKKSTNAVEEPKAKNKVLSKGIFGGDVEDKENVATSVKGEDENENETEQDRKIRLKNVERLINDAKDRIKLLQLENQRLDQSFNTYLERQSSQTMHFQQDTVAIWENYNVDRLLLEQRKKINPKEPAKTMDQLLTKLVVVPQIQIEKCKSNLEVGNELEAATTKTIVKDTASTGTVMQEDAAELSVAVEAAKNKSNSSGEFSNPFINFDIKQFLESTTRPLVDETKSKSLE